MTEAPAIESSPSSQLTPAILRQYMLWSVALAVLAIVAYFTLVGLVALRNPNHPQVRVENLKAQYGLATVDGAIDVDPGNTARLNVTDASGRPCSFEVTINNGDDQNFKPTRGSLKLEDPAGNPLPPGRGCQLKEGI